MNGGAEEQADGFRTREQRVREVGVDEHPEQAEGHDVGDGVGDFAFVGVDRRRGGDDRGDAADAGAGGDQRAEPRRQAQLAVEPRHEDQARGDGGEHDRQSREPELTTSKTLRRMPTSTMPSRSTVVVSRTSDPG